jgi:uncharacterized protein YecT (DUF1311 family)
LVRALTLLLLFLLAASPASALDQSQIKSACYEDCAKETGSNPEFKACVARAADTADGLLNEEFASLQESVRNAAKDMEVKPDTQLDMLTAAQRQWIAFRDSTCAFEDSLAFGGTATGGIASSCICALSYERINDFDRVKHSVLGE